MTTRVQESIMVNVPVSVAYNQWTQFEEFPQFMGGVTSVTQLADDRLRWVAQIAGVKRQWEARILEQVPDRKVAWAATEGATNAGSVEFEDVGGGQTQVTLSLEYEPEGLVEKVGDKLHVVENQATSDLERFKAFIESEGYATGAWRGEVDAARPVGTPGVEEAAASRGDSGKAGISGKAAAGLAAAAVAGAAAVAAARGGSDDDSAPEAGAADVEVVEVEVVPVESSLDPGVPPLGEDAGTTGAQTTEPVQRSYEGVQPPPGVDVASDEPMDEIYAATDQVERESRRP